MGVVRAAGMGLLAALGGDPGPRRRPNTTLSGTNNVYFTIIKADGKRLFVYNLLVRTAFLWIKAAILYHNNIGCHI